MQSNIQNYQGGGYVFIDATTKRPLTHEFRKDYDTAKKYWVRHFNKSPSVIMKPVADVQFFFMHYAF